MAFKMLYILQNFLPPLQIIFWFMDAKGWFEVAHKQVNCFTALRNGLYVDGDKNLTIYVNRRITLDIVVVDVPPWQPANVPGKSQ